MKNSVRSFCLAGVSLAASVCAAGTTVRVSSFGYDAEDSTEIVQRALDSGARRIVFDKKEGPWVVRPVFVRSNSEVVFEEGVELVAKRGEFQTKSDSLVSLVDVTNVVLRGMGRGATFRMWREDYRKPPYPRGEHRHALNLLSVRQLTIENLTFRDSGGDGIYLGEKWQRGKDKTNVDVVIRDCVCDANYRQGISLITARNLLIERTVLRKTCGTDPQTGFDVEPNYASQEVVNCVLRDCTIEQNRIAGCWVNLNHFRSKTKPVSLTLENCQLIGNGGPAFMLNLNPFIPEEQLPRGGFVRLVKCTLGGRGTGAYFCAKRRGSVDVSFEDCLFDGSGSAKPDVSFLVQNRQGAYDDGISFRNVTIHQAKAREWFGAANRPWIAPPSAISGDVTIVSPEGSRREILDEKWIKSRFSAPPEWRIDFTHEGLDPAVARPVDHAPGRSVKLSPLKFRGVLQAWVYADGPREISIRAVQMVIGRRSPATGIVPVMSVDGKKVAEVSVPGRSQTELRFTVPAAGFYSMTFKTKGHAIAFLSADVPLGIVPGCSQAGAEHRFDIYFPAGKLYFRHARDCRSILFVGGGGLEYASFKVTGPTGETLLDEKGIAHWGFLNVGGKPSDGLYCIDISRPAGLNWEDTFVDLRGEPAVFFLTSEKYW